MTVDAFEGPLNGPTGTEEAVVFSYAKISISCENREADANRMCSTK